MRRRVGDGVATAKCGIDLESNRGRTPARECVSTRARPAIARKLATDRGSIKIYVRELLPRLERGQRRKARRELGFLLVPFLPLFLVLLLSACATSLARLPLPASELNQRGPSEHPSRRSNTYLGRRKASWLDGFLKPGCRPDGQVPRRLRQAALLSGTLRRQGATAPTAPACLPGGPLLAATRVRRGTGIGTGSLITPFAFLGSGL